MNIEEKAQLSQVLVALEMAIEQGIGNEDPFIKLGFFTGASEISIEIINRLIKSETDQQSRTVIQGMTAQLKELSQA